MLHHISRGALNIERAARFYDAALEPLGYVRVWSDSGPASNPEGHRLEAVCKAAG
jgi:hypothetical protein